MSLPSVILVWALTALAGSGLALSVYLTATFLRIQSGRVGRCLDGSCPVVMQTPYARTLGFPNFFLAVPYYSGLHVINLAITLDLWLM